MSRLAPIYKAVAAGLLTGLGSIQATLQAGSMDARGWVQAAIAFLVGTGIVYAIPNKPAAK